MTSINKINVNTQGIGHSYGFNAKPKAENKEAKEAEIVAKGENTQVPADKVLDYLAKSAVSVTPQKTVDPAKYVDGESAARIAGFMADFEDKVAEGLKAFEQEFKGANVSDSAKMAIVLAGIDKEV